MKLRLDKEHIIVRLTDWDLGNLVSEQSVSEEVYVSENNQFAFTVQISNQTEALIARFEVGKLIITVSEAVLVKWTNSNQIGIKATVNADNGQSVEIVVEKDLPPRKMKSKG